jgi:hypothetical protein
MKIKTIFLFVCVSVTCLAVQFGIYKGIVKGAVDPCPQTTTKSSTPCPFTGELISSCAVATSCTGETVFYSAEVKNTDYQDNKPAETYTTVVTYTPPNRYQCAIWKKCYRESNYPYACIQMDGTTSIGGNLYTVHSCSD